MTQPMVVGQGPIRVLVLHGWFGSAAAWKAFAAVVDTERFSYAFLDARGYGTRKDESGPFTMETMAQDAIAAADALGWERFSLIGHSMAGKAVLRALQAAPERVQKLVGVTPVPANGVPFDAGTGALFASAASQLEARRTIINFSTGDRLSAHWVEQTAQHSWTHSTPAAFGAYLPSWAEGDFSAELRGQKLPMLLIVGEHDASITPAVMQATYLQTFPQAKLEVMANAGHYPMDETPVALATCIERFLAEAS